MGSYWVGIEKLPIWLSNRAWMKKMKTFEKRETVRAVRASCQVARYSPFIQDRQKGWKHLNMFADSPTNLFFPSRFWCVKNLLLLQRLISFILFFVFFLSFCFLDFPCSFFSILCFFLFIFSYFFFLFPFFCFFFSCLLSVSVFISICLLLSFFLFVFFLPVFVLTFVYFLSFCSFSLFHSSFFLFPYFFIYFCLILFVCILVAVYFLSSFFSFHFCFCLYLSFPLHLRHPDLICSTLFSIYVHFL